MDFHHSHIDRSMPKSPCLNILIIVSVMIGYALLCAAIISSSPNVNIMYAAFAIFVSMVIIGMIGGACYYAVELCKKLSARRTRTNADPLMSENESSDSDSLGIEDDATVILIDGNGEIDYDAVYYSDQSVNESIVCHLCSKNEWNVILKCDHKLYSNCVTDMTSFCPCCKMPILDGMVVV